MSLQPSDAAAEAFDRLRSEVALLRRALEGLVVDAGAASVDYSPTLADLSNALADVNTQVTGLGERPLLALAPDQLGSLFQLAAARVLAKPLAELDQERTVLSHAAESFRVAREVDMARSRSLRRQVGLLLAASAAGGIACCLLLGPFARILPAAWNAPERLASAALGLPMAPAGERLLSRGDPETAEALILVRALSIGERAQLQRCLSQPARPKPKPCVIKLYRGQSAELSASSAENVRKMRHLMVAFDILDLSG